MIGRCIVWTHECNAMQGMAPGSIENPLIQDSRYALQCACEGQQSSYSDVTLEVGDDLLPAHRVVLAGSSDFFKALFKASFEYPMGMPSASSLHYTCLLEEIETKTKPHEHRCARQLSAMGVPYIIAARYIIIASNQVCLRSRGCWRVTARSWKFGKQLHRTCESSSTSIMVY